MTKKRKWHTPEQIVKKLRDAEAMKNSGKELAAVLQVLGVSEATYHRCRISTVVAKEMQTCRDGQQQD